MIFLFLHCEDKIQNLSRARLICAPKLHPGYVVSGLSWSQFRKTESKAGAESDQNVSQKRCHMQSNKHQITKFDFHLVSHLWSCEVFFFFSLAGTQEENKLSLFKATSYFQKNQDHVIITLIKRTSDIVK